MGVMGQVWSEDEQAVCPPKSFEGMQTDLNLIGILLEANDGNASMKNCK